MSDTWTPADIKQLRKGLGLSQQQFAERYRLPLAALQNWEQGRRRPDRAACIVLQLVRLAPSRIAALLALPGQP